MIAGSPDRMRRKAERLGFTIVELLIVVVVIGILAAIVTVAYTGVTQSANASAVADGFKKFEKAMRLFATSQGYTSWPTDSTITGGGNPNIASLIASAPGFSNYMQSPPNVAGISSALWRYDNDGDTYNGCSASLAGTSIYVSSFPDTALAQQVDNILDDGDLTCGRMRWGGSAGSTLLFSLSNDGTL